MIPFENFWSVWAGNRKDAAKEAMLPREREVKMNLFMIAKCNMRKNKSMTVTLVILIIFAAIFLYIGTSVILEMNSFLDRKNRELEGSDFTIFAPVRYEAAVNDLMDQMDGYEKLETVKAVSANATIKNITQKKKDELMSFLFLNGDRNEEIAQLRILDEGDSKLPNSIILPYYLKIAKGYRTGDEISISYGGQTHQYVIYGFAEDVMFAIPSNVPCYKCYLFEEEFNQRYEEESTRYFLLKTILSEGTDLGQFSSRYVKELNERITDSTSLITAMDFDSMKVGVSLFFQIIMIFLIVFSMIIILIALTVIRFAVVTYIEGNIQNIGSMEALGYTGKELVRSTVLQFVLISLGSTLLGLMIAASCAGIITDLVSSSIGLKWNGGINIPAMIINLMLILFLVAVTAYLTAAKIKRITPITALRSGINTHNFKKNYFPADKYKWNLNLLMGLKILMHNMRQNITILIIVTLMSFVCVFSFMTNYNFIIDNTAVMRLVGLETSHLSINYIDSNSVKIFDEISRMEQIKKTVRISRIEMTLSFGKQEAAPTVSICNDFSLLEINTVVQGRYPVHDNEIAVTSLILKQLGAKLGDSIILTGAELKEDYLIVGITQQMSSLGRGAYITEEGMKRISPEFVPSDLLIYLEDEKDIASVTKSIEKNYESLPIIITNTKEASEGILETFNKAITGFCIGCIVITLSIISMVMYLLIRIKLMKEKVRLGVSKALGFTTRQLIFQVICSFCPVCMVGALMGTVIASYATNPLLAAMLSMAGSIKNCHFIISPGLTLTTFLSITLFFVLLTGLIAGAVRKITPCELFR